MYSFNFGATSTLRVSDLEQCFVLFIDQVDRELRREENEAAVVLQRNWRGFRVRAGLQQRVTKTTRLRAAVKIQRFVSGKIHVHVPVLAYFTGILSKNALFRFQT